MIFIKKRIFLAALLCQMLCTTTIAQTINFTDPKFKLALTAAGVDANSDGSITVSEALAVTSLDISSSYQVEYMDEIGAFKNLVSLDCSFNELYSLNLNQNTKLTYLDCSANPITDLYISGCTKLVTLNCYNLQITSLDVYNCPDLTSIDCHLCNITYLDLFYNTKLVNLNASYNAITSLNVTTCLPLKVLFCHSNDLTSLDVKPLSLNTLWAQGNDDLDVICISSIPSISNSQFRKDDDAQWSLCNQVPAISFANLSKTYGEAAFSVNAASTSPGAFTYSIISGSTYASVTSAGLVTILGAGDVTIKATQDPGGVYTTSSATMTLTIGKATLTAKAEDKSRDYNTSNPAFTVAYSGFAYTDNASVITTQSVAATTATQSSDAGNYTITVSGGSAANYTIVPSSGTLTINKVTPALTYTGATSGQKNTQIVLSASSNSTGGFSYSVANGTGSASLSGSTLSLDAGGTVTVTVNQAASTNYLAATISEAIYIFTQNATLSFTIPFSKSYGDAPFSVSATSNSSAPITYSIIGGNEYATITSAGEVTILGAGTIEVKATQAAGSSYGPASATALMSIDRIYPTVTYTGPVLGFTGGIIELSGTSNSGGALTYHLTNISGSASLSGNKLTLLTAGSVYVTVEVALTNNYWSTSDGSQININNLSEAFTPDITFNGTTKTYGDAPFTLSASSDAAGQLTYSITSGTSFASITPAGELTITGAGTATVKVSQAALGSYEATSKTASVVINKASLTATAEDKTREENTADPEFTIAYSGFVYSDDASMLTEEPEAATNALAASGAGVYDITLSGGVSDNYDFTLVDGQLTITPAQPPVVISGIEELSDKISVEIFPNPVTDVLNIKTEEPFVEGKINLFNAQGRLVYSAENISSNQFKIPMHMFAGGLYLLTLETSEGKFTKRIVK